MNVTDGQYTCLRASRPDGPLYTHSALPPQDDERMRAVDDFLPYTAYPVWQLSADPSPQNTSAELYNVRSDPDQTDDLVGTEPATEQWMRELLIEAMDALDAPEEQYERLDLVEHR